MKQVGKARMGLEREEEVGISPVELEGKTFREK